MQVGHFSAEHDDGAMAAVVAGVGEFERIRARDLHLAVFVTREPHAGKSDRVIEELQLIAFARRAAGADRPLAGLQAVGPQEAAEGDEENGRRFPHQASLMRSAALSATAITEALMFPDGTDGMTDASTTRRPPTPLTFSLSAPPCPRLQVEVGWNTVSPAWRTKSSSSSSLCTLAPGYSSPTT